MALSLPRRALCQVPPPSTEEIRKIAESAYLFAYPLVLMEYTRHHAPANVFNHAREFPAASFRGVVRPNADTLYSTAWLDLSKEPVVLHVPDTGGRYYVMQMLDAWTETFAVPGKRTTGNREGRFAIVGPGWRGELPSGGKRLDAPTNLVWLLGRTQTNTAADYENVRRIQGGYTLTPLSRYPEASPATVSNAPLAGAGGDPPPVRIARLSTVDFFREFHQLLSQNPPHTDDGPIMARIARLGLEPGKPFDSERLGAEGWKAVDEGARAGAGQLSIRPASTPKAGWTGFGGRVGRYGTDYLSRAQIARAGLGALPPEEAIYLNCTADSEARPLNGASQYKLHFAPGAVPPVRAFWSLTLYDSAGYFVGNSIGRYAIGDRDRLELNPDGSLDLYIQHAAPGESKDRNWLPAPEGAFNLTLRIYWPKEEVLNGRWTPPPVTRRQ